ncbi:MAG: hypothetical protein BWY74_02039 [Firmicutes bacterium ADurb.Bin419]|nr:MAG: hypothetical protein BWY74_02039 [Firmicutes bacterium ADurb.Bin419]
MQQSNLPILERLSLESDNKLFTEYASRYFFWKHNINPRVYNNMDNVEIIYRLQKKYPEFCMIFFWHDNGLSKQQEHFINSNNQYDVGNVMKAWWAVKYNLRGPIWPIHGFTQDAYLEIRSDANERVIKQMIESEVFNYKKHELLWNEHISFKSGTYIVSYVAQYLKVIEFMFPALGVHRRDLEDYISQCLWDGSIVNPNVQWVSALSQSATIGTPGVAVADTVYNILNKYYIKKHPNLFSYLFNNIEQFEILYADEPKEVKNIRLNALEQGRPLTKIENDYIDSVLNPQPINIELLKSKLDAIKKEARDESSK